MFCGAEMMSPTAICRLKAGSSTVEITALAWGAASEHVNLVGDTVSGGLHPELLKGRFGKAYVATV